jgi:hypothetical protein
MLEPKPITERKRLAAVALERAASAVYKVALAKAAPGDIDPTSTWQAAAVAIDKIARMLREQSTENDDVIRARLRAAADSFQAVPTRHRGARKKRSEPVATKRKAGK